VLDVIDFVKTCLRNLNQILFFIPDSSDRRTISHVGIVAWLYLNQRLNVQLFTLV